MESKNVLLIFSKKIMYKPIIYRLVKDYDVLFNVLEAKIFPRQEGRIILELRGEKETLEESLKYLGDSGVLIEYLTDNIHRDEDRCIHCGACTAVCSVEALVIDRETMEVLFHPERCVACGLCKLACPMHAMSGASIDLDN